MQKQTRQRVTWLVSIILPLALAGGAACYIYMGRGTSRATARAEEPAVRQHSRVSPARVEVVQPHRGGMARTTVQPGTVQSYEMVQLYAGVSGYLKTQTVDIGDRVKRRQELARVDVPDLDKEVQRRAASLEQAKARVKVVQARVASARADEEVAKASITKTEAAAESARANRTFREKQFLRMKDLLSQGSIDERLVDEKQEQHEAAIEAERAARAAILVAKAELLAAGAKVQQAEADVLDAQAAVLVARADLEKAQVMIQFATVVSPFDGVITNRNLFPGDFIRAANESGSHLPLLTVQRTDRVRVVVQIPDRDVPYADPGDSAVVEIDALPGQKLEGKIARIASAEDPRTRLMHVEIDLPNPTGKICQGMYGQVTIVLDKGADLLWLPSSCLAGKSQDGKGVIYVVRDGSAHRTAIRLGADDGLRVAVESGLTADDAVVLHPGNGLADGAPVAVAAAPAIEGADR